MHLKDLNDAKSAAEKQAELTQTKIDVEIAGNFLGVFVFDWSRFIGSEAKDVPMNGIIYLVGLVVVVMLILSFLGLR